MTELTIEEAFAEAQRQIRQLKETVVRKDMQYHDLEMNNKFYMIKATELAEILHLKRPDEMKESLETKAIQNAELTVQVQALRDHLNTSMEKNERLDADLKLSTETVAQLAKERKSHQRMLVELSDVVRALGRIEVEYDKAQNTSSNWMSPGEESLENIKRKIHAIEENRQRKIKENDILRSEIASRDERIDALQKLTLRLDATNDSRDELIEENKLLRQKCLVGNYCNCRPSSIPGDVAYDLKKRRRWQQPADDDNHVESQLVSNDDGSTEVVLTASVSNITHFPDEEEKESYSLADDLSSFSSLEAPAVQVVGETDSNIQVQISQLKDRYQSEKAEHEKTKKRVRELEGELQESNKRVVVSKKKQDLRDGLLRDVIHQYKELQGEHDEATAKINQLQEQLEQQHTQGESRTKGNKKKHPPQKVFGTGKSKFMQQQQDYGQQEYEFQNIEETITFELSEDTPSEVSSMHSMVSMRSASTTNGCCTEQEEEEEDEFSVHSVTYFDEDMVSEFNRLDCECARLEHEYDNAVIQIANLEDELENTKEERDAAIARQKDLEEEVLESELELSQIRHDFDAVVDKSNGLEEERDAAIARQKDLEEEVLESEVELSQIRQNFEAVVDKSNGLEKDLKATRKEADQACKRQKELEEDLLSVNSQFKQVAEEKEKAISKIECVERELLTVNRQAQQVRRRNLICELKRAQQQYNDALDDTAEMKQKVQRANSESIQSKADAKNLRKRMTGCHFHFKRLQQEYNDILSDKARIERELTRTKNEVKRYKAQEEGWSEKITGIRERRKQAEEESKRLKEQNSQLKSYCNNLLLVAAQGVPDEDPLLVDAEETLDHLLA